MQGHILDTIARATTLTYECVVQSDTKNERDLLRSMFVHFPKSMEIIHLKNICGWNMCVCSVNRQPGYRVWIIEMDIKIRNPDHEIDNTQIK